jgi:hypothetical protein
VDPLTRMGMSKYMWTGTDLPGEIGVEVERGC